MQPQISKTSVESRGLNFTDHLQLEALFKPEMLIAVILYKNLQTRTLEAMTFLCGSYFNSGENNGGINSAEFEASI